MRVTGLVIRKLSSKNELVDYLELVSLIGTCFTVDNTLMKAKLKLYRFSIVNPLGVQY